MSFMASAPFLQSVLSIRRRKNHRMSPPEENSGLDNRLVPDKLFTAEDVPRRTFCTITVRWRLDLDDLPTLKIQTDGDRGPYVCVPRALTAELREYLDEGRNHYIVNPRRIQSRRPKGYDMFLFGPIGDRAFIRDLLTDFGFDVSEFPGDAT